MPKIYLPFVAKDGPPPYYGLALADPAHREDIQTLSAEWWYDWTPTGQVPMLWGGNPSDAIPADYAGNLLFLNEPNLESQSNVTPQEAVAKLAIARARYPHARIIGCGVSVWATYWTSAFYAAGGKVDAWHVHAYTEEWITPEVAQSYIQIHRNITGGTYWITEYGSPVGSLDDFRAMTEWFRAQPWIERIAAYTNRQPDGVPWAIGAGVEMVRDDGTLAPIGDYYRGLIAEIIR